MLRRPMVEAMECRLSDLGVHLLRVPACDKLMSCGGRRMNRKVFNMRPLAPLRLGLAGGGMICLPIVTSVAGRS